MSHLRDVFLQRPGTFPCSDRDLGRRWSDWVGLGWTRVTTGLHVGGSDEILPHFGGCAEPPDLLHLLLLLVRYEVVLPILAP